MRVYRNLAEYHEKTPLALSLGMFDGVHLGHQTLINQLKKLASQNNEETAILTFWPHPRKVFKPNDDLKLLSTIDEKIDLFEKEGLDKVFVKSFDDDFINLTGEEFIRKILSEKLNVKHIIIGYDHKFGKNQSGDFELLKKLSHELNYEVAQIGAVSLDEVSVSSTKIRKALEEGNIKLANEMLSYNYSISGEVIEGDKIGRKLGFPTANIRVSDIKLLPKSSAYIVKVKVGENDYSGMLNIGLRPTVNGTKMQTEVYILDFNENIYNQNITIEFIDFLRGERKFNGIDELVAQLKNDEEFCRNYFKS